MHQFRIMHISESFLNVNITSSLASIPNYNVYCSDRVGKQDGGLISYIHSSLNHSPLPDLPNTHCQDVSYITTNLLLPW